MTSLLVIIHRDTTNVLASVLELTSQASLARTKILAISKKSQKIGNFSKSKIFFRGRTLVLCGYSFKIENVLGVRCTLRTLMTMENRPMF